MIELFYDQENGGLQQNANDTGLIMRVEAHGACLRPIP